MLGVVFSISALIAVILLLRKCFLHIIPKLVMVLLWCVAIVRSLILVPIPSKISIFNLVRLDMGNSADITAQTAGGGAQAAALGRISPLETVWLAGIVVVAAYFVIAYIRLYHRFSDAETCGVTEKAKGLGRPITIKVTEKIRSPLCYGFFRPVILLPKKDILNYGKDELHYVLVHEINHIRKGDIFLKLALACAACLNWYNPLVWTMYAVANHDIEMRCDEAVLRQKGVDGKRYWDLVARQTFGEKISDAFASFARRSSKERLAAISKVKKPPVAVTVLAVIVICVTTTTFAFNGVDNTASAGQADTAPKTVEAVPAESAVPETQPMPASMAETEPKETVSYGGGQERTAVQPSAAAKTPEIKTDDAAQPSAELIPQETAGPEEPSGTGTASASDSGTEGQQTAAPTAPPPAEPAAQDVAPAAAADVPVPSVMPEGAQAVDDGSMEGQFYDNVIVA